MPSVTIVINSKPQPQGRPRFCMRGKHAVAFDPNKQTKDFIKLLVYDQFHERLECAIEMDVTFFMPIPKSSSLKKKALMRSGTTKHIKRSDLDNNLKLLLDCFNDIVFKDDSQVWHINMKKVYSDDPRTEATIYWEEDEPKLTF